METIQITKVIADPNQPRKYFGADKMAVLKKSVKEHGIVNPIIVEKKGDKYLIVDGERRFRVATELGLKTVPIAVISSKDPIARLIEQFHIQETHEGWNPVEKAQVLIQLCEQTKRPLTQVCVQLNIPKKTAWEYLSFAKIINKEEFIEHQIPVSLSQPLVSLITYAKNLTLNELNDTFSLTDQKKLEKSLIQNIKDGNLVDKSDLSKMKDVFRMDPKSIKKIMDGANAQEVYAKSKARGARFARNIVNNSSFLCGNARGFIENPDVKLDIKDVQIIRSCYRALKDLLAFVGDHE